MVFAVYVVPGVHREFRLWNLPLQPPQTRGGGMPTPWLRLRDFSAARMMGSKPSHLVKRENRL